MAQRAWLDEELKRLQIRPSAMVYNLKDPDITATALQLRNLIIQNDQAAQETSSDFYFTVATALVRHNPFRPSKARCRLNARQLRLALDYINGQINTPLPIADVANAAGGLSEFHFAHAFSSSLGQSLHQYIIDRRVAHAAQLLATGRLSL